MDWHYFHSSFIALDRGKRENAHTRSPILLTMGVKKSFHPGKSLQGDAETENMDHEEKKITGMLYGMAPVWNLAKVLKHEGNTVKGMLCGLLRGMIPPGNIAKELSIGYQNRSRCGDVTDRWPRNEDQRRSRYNNTRERQRSHHARAVSDETSRFYGTARSYGFATKEYCYNCGLSNHDTNECHFLFPITCRSCCQSGTGNL